MSDIANRDLLIRFCRDVDQAIRTNGNDVPWFSRDCGLCHNLVYWSMHNNLSDTTSRSIESYMQLIFVEMRRHSHEMRSSAYPFNNSISEYWSEQDEGIIYDNTSRLEFIRLWATRPLKEEFAGFRLWTYEAWEQILTLTENATLTRTEDSILLLDRVRI